MADKEPSNTEPKAKVEGKKGNNSENGKPAPSAQQKVRAPANKPESSKDKAASSQTAKQESVKDDAAPQSGGVAKEAGSVKDDAASQSGDVTKEAGSVKDDAAPQSGGVAKQAGSVKDAAAPQSGGVAKQAGSAPASDPSALQLHLDPIQRLAATLSNAGQYDIRLRLAATEKLTLPSSISTHIFPPADLFNKQDLIITINLSYVQLQAIETFLKGGGTINQTGPPYIDSTEGYRFPANAAVKCLFKTGYDLGYQHSLDDFLHSGHTFGVDAIRNAMEGGDKKVMTGVTMKQTGLVPPTFDYPQFDTLPGSFTWPAELEAYKDYPAGCVQTTEEMLADTQVSSSSTDAWGLKTYDWDSSKKDRGKSLFEQLSVSNVATMGGGIPFADPTTDNKRLVAQEAATALAAVLQTTANLTKIWDSIVDERTKIKAKTGADIFGTRFFRRDGPWPPKNQAGDTVHPAITNNTGQYYGNRVGGVFVELPQGLEYNGARVNMPKDNSSDPDSRLFVRWVIDAKLMAGANSAHVKYVDQDAEFV